MASRRRRWGGLGRSDRGRWPLASGGLPRGARSSSVPVNADRWEHLLCARASMMSTGGGAGHGDTGADHAWSLLLSLPLPEKDSEEL